MSSRIHLLTILALVVAVVSGCARVSRERTLPPSIRSVDVPLFVNRTAEPGLEEDVTIYTQEEFLADGRLDLVRQNEADAIVNVELTGFEEQAEGFDSDDFPRQTRYTVSADVRILQNIPGQPQFGPRRKVSATRSFINDTRRITYETKNAGRELVLKELARRIVLEVLTGGTGTTYDSSPGSGQDDNFGITF